MRSDNFGQLVLSTEDVFNAIYSGKIKLLDILSIESSTEIEKFNQAVKTNYDSFKQIVPYQEPKEFDSIELFDEANQLTWFMPEDANKFPIVDWLYEQCNNDLERARVDEELILFIQHGMFDLLFYLKYLVDTMRENKIIWGVGRGSSVASYVLYLLGIHKVDSIKYKLDIHEFLK